jgi:hypothetical protein
MPSTAAPYKDHGGTAEDDVFYCTGIENGFHGERCRLAPGSIVLGLEVLADVFCAVRIFFCVRDE